MAITVPELRDALRVPDDSDDAILGRVLGAAQTIVDVYATLAAADLRNEAVMLTAAYLYDQPAYSSSPSNAFRNSGAEALLRRYVWRRGLVAGAGCYGDRS